MRLAVTALVVAALGAAGCVSQADITRTCEKRGGVISYEDHTWGATNGAGTVICRDGTAWKAS